MRVLLGLCLLGILWHAGLVTPAHILHAAAAHPGWVALAALSHTVVFFLLGIRWARIAREAHFPVPRPLGVKLAFVSHLFSSVLPGNGAGDLVKAWVASRQNLQTAAADVKIRNADGSCTEMVGRRREPVRMGVPQALATMVPDRLTGMTGLWAAWSICLVAVLVTLPEAQPLWPALIVALLGTVALLVILFFLPSFSRKLSGWTEQTRFAALLQPVRSGLSSLEECGASRGVLLQSVMISIVLQFFFFTAAWACARALELDVPVLLLGATMPLVSLANSIPLSPGGVGIGESVAALSLKAVGRQVGAGADVMFLLRLVLWGLAVVGLVCWLSLRGGNSEPGRHSENL